MFESSQQTISFLTAIGIVILIALFLGLEFAKLYREWSGKSDEKKIAMTKRILENLIPIALLLVTEAEKLYGDKMGEMKKAYVIDQLYSRIPEAFKPFVTEENLTVILETVLVQAKLLWEEKQERFVVYSQAGVCPYSSLSLSQK